MENEAVRSMKDGLTLNYVSRQILEMRCSEEKGSVTFSFLALPGSDKDDGAHDVVCCESAWFSKNIVTHTLRSVAVDMICNH